MAREPRREGEGEGLRNPRVTDAIDRAVRDGSLDDLLEQLARSSGLPGLRPNLDFARAVGHAIAAHRAHGDKLVRALGGMEQEFPKIVSAMAMAGRAAIGLDRAGAHAGLQVLAEDSRHVVRMGVVAAVRDLARAAPLVVVEELAAWTDGYFQAHIALEALSDRRVLDALPSSESLVARLDEAYFLADASSRAAERAQGVRTLREAMPGQIAAFAARFSEVVGWLDAKALGAKRPETREVIDCAIAALRKGSFRESTARELDRSLAKSAKPPRDPSRIVKGTRRRGKDKT